MITFEVVGSLMPLVLDHELMMKAGTSNRYLHSLEDENWDFTQVKML